MVVYIITGNQSTLCEKNMLYKSFHTEIKANLAGFHNLNCFTFLTFVTSYIRGLFWLFSLVTLDYVSNIM